MDERDFGIMLIGIAVLMCGMLYSYNSAIHNSIPVCYDDATCDVLETTTFFTTLSMTIIAIVVLMAIYLVVRKKAKSKAPTNTAKNEELDSEEKSIIDKVREHNGTIFQSELVEKTGMSKVKVTRILDRLEGKGLLERKRRGMSNVILLRH